MRGKGREEGRRKQAKRVGRSSVGKGWLRLSKNSPVLDPIGLFIRGEIHAKITLEKTEDCHLNGGNGMNAWEGRDGQ